MVDAISGNLGFYKCEIMDVGLCVIVFRRFYVIRMNGLNVWHSVLVALRSVNIHFLSIHLSVYLSMFLSLSFFSLSLSFPPLSRFSSSS